MHIVKILDRRPSIWNDQNLFFFLAILVMIHGTKPNVASFVGPRDIASPNWPVCSTRRTESAAWKQGKHKKSPLRKSIRSTSPKREEGE